jgi:ribonuclease HI
MPEHAKPDPPEVQLFTDGACSGNPGPGGWAFILRHPATGKELEQSGGEAETTNNRMELMAVIRGLEALKRPTHVELFTDSEYVRQGLSTWMPKWKRNGWQRSIGPRAKPGAIKNLELWKRLDQLIARHRLKFTRVAGHSGHPENDRCDELAVAACRKYKR